MSVSSVHCCRLSHFMAVYLYSYGFLASNSMGSAQWMGKYVPPVQAIQMCV